MHTHVFMDSTCVFTDARTYARDLQMLQQRVTQCNRNVMQHKENETWSTRQPYVVFTFRKESEMVFVVITKWRLFVMSITGSSNRHLETI